MGYKSLVMVPDGSVTFMPRVIIEFSTLIGQKVFITAILKEVQKCVYVTFIKRVSVQHCATDVKAEHYVQYYTMGRNFCLFFLF